MLPIQEIEILTKRNRKFFVHLEKWKDDHYECKLAAIELGPQLPADSTFGPFSKGSTACEAFESLISSFRSALAKLDPNDSIAVVDNPCNTEFFTADAQKQVLGQDVKVKVNGNDA